MAWVAVDKNGTECICSTKPYRDWIDYMWCVSNILNSCAIELPNRKEDAQAVIDNPNFREILDTVYKY